MNGTKNQAGDTKAPLRRCLVTGETGPRDGMIRFVAAPDGTVVADLDGHLPGRGMWLLARRDVLAAAASGQHFSRAFGAPLMVSADFVSEVEAGLASRLSGLVGMARRAGAAVAGFEKVMGALKSGKARLLIAASDGAEDGRAKICAQAGDVPVVTALDGDELGRVFGRDVTVHVAVTDKALAARIMHEANRLSGIRTGAATSGNRGVSETLVKDRVGAV